MFVRNCLRAGDYLVPVPVGVPVTLEYNDGWLSKVYLNYDNHKTILESSFFEIIKSETDIPSKVPIKIGMTWVKGVLYSGTHISCDGFVFSEVVNKMITDFLHNPRTYRFFAVDVESNATMFHGAGPVRQWLKMNGFKVIMGQLVPATINEKTFNTMWSGKYQFEYPLMMYYFIWRGLEKIVRNTLMIQHTCKRVCKNLLENGSLQAVIYTESEEKVEVDYYDVTSNQVRAGSIFYMDDNNHIIYSWNDNTKSKFNEEIICPVCGKTYVPKKYTHCDDDTCLSLKYFTVNNILKAFGMHEISFKDYIIKVKNNEILSVGDVLNCDEYLDYQLNASLYSVLRAMIPLSAARNDDTVSSFVNRCNNNVDSLKYYISNPSRAKVDFEITDSKFDDMLDWFSKNENVADIINVLDNPRYNPSYRDRLFDGPPIFRDRKIYLTGKFKHGDMNSIISILQSYGAEVTDKFGSDIDCVVIGDILENINARNVKSAQNMRIPVMEESQFFDKYDIDSDIQQNLQ